MELTRTIAFKLAKDGVLEVLQKGRVIPVEDLGKIKGPIRLRKRDMDK